MSAALPASPRHDLALTQALTQVSPQQQEKARKSSQDFEAVFLNTMFQQMYSSAKGEGPFGDTTGTGAWRSMLTEQYSKSIVSGGGVGISADVFRSLIMQQAGASATAG